MSAIKTLLEVLWASERVLASPSLTPKEQEVILKELKSSLPSSFHCVSSMGTRSIVEAKLTPTPSIITDETPIGPAEDVVPPTRDSTGGSERSKTKANKK